MNIIVTGASSGIGFETVKKLSEDSSHRIVAIARNKSSLQKLQQDCKKINPSSNIVIIDFDLSNKNLSQQLIPEIMQHISSVDVLINNAAIVLNKNFTQITDQELENVFNTNVFSAFRLIRELKILMGKSQTTHIVNISSMGGFQGSAKFPGLSAYSSSKAAIASLTECLAEEFKNDNIKVNCLAFGSVQTEMLSKAFPGFQAPLTAAEMGNYLADFSINGSRFFNGKIIPVALTTP